MPHLPIHPAQKPARSRDPYPIQPLLTCDNCRADFFGTTLTDGTQAYRSRCGCRLHPIPARDIEHRIYAHTLNHVYAQGGALLCDCLPLLAEHLFTTVALDPTGEHIRFVPLN